MTWQCPRCMVTFRTNEEPHVNRRGYGCESPGCAVRYMEGMSARLGNKAIMYLVSASPAMEEYRRHYEKDFPDA